jgi:hypothetical protein
MTNDINEDAFTAFDFESFAKTLSRRSDISGDIAQKYISEIEEYSGKFPSEKFEQSIGVIFEALYNEKNKSKAPVDRSISPLIDDAYGKEEICKAAQILSKTPGIQSSYFVNTALLTVLDTELYPLNRELTDTDSFNSLLIRNGYRGFISGMISAMMPKGSVWISVIFKALLYLALIGITVISILSKHYWVSFLAGSFYAYLEYKRWKLKKFIKHLATCYSGLKQIRDEIEKGAYNSKRIAEKLKDMEKNRTYVPSIAYSLLECFDKSLL